jgi:hypothetical protein
MQTTAPTTTFCIVFSAAVAYRSFLLPEDMPLADEEAEGGDVALEEEGG